jgi:hypothetical protein
MSDGYDIKWLISATQQMTLLLLKKYIYNSSEEKIYASSLHKCLVPMIELWNWGRKGGTWGRGLGCAQVCVPLPLLPIECLVTFDI